MTYGSSAAQRICATRTKVGQESGRNYFCAHVDTRTLPQRINAGPVIEGNGKARLI
jgi:hypothetical protein